jgi:uncharacterized protein (TIGR03382 family)
VNDSWPGPPPSEDPEASFNWRVPLAGVLVAAALVGAWFAYLTWGLLSTGDVGDHTTPLLNEQLIVGVAGLLPVGVLAVAILRRRNRTAVALAVVAIATYLFWGILNDASVHGWSNLQVF